MPVTAACATCDKPYKVSSKLAGKSVRCPHCQSSIRVPLASAKPTAPAKDDRPAPQR
jgi:DNA-directed RNA polymerase subunit RPC12/RpoP